MNERFQGIYKSLYRLKVKKSLAELTASERKRKSRLIARKLFHNAIYLHAKNIFTYVSLPCEVDTRPIIAHALAEGKQVFVPKLGRRKSLGVCALKDPSKDLQMGKYGIFEPFGLKPILRTKLGFDLLLIPGLAFDQKRFRLGRGQGYFDRFLEKISGPRIGLAFREQCLQDLPVAPHDLGMDEVICD